MTFKRIKGIPAGETSGIWLTSDERFFIYRQPIPGNGERKRKAQDWRVNVSGYSGFTTSQVFDDHKLLMSIGFVDSDGRSLASFPSRKATADMLLASVYKAP